MPAQGSLRPTSSVAECRRYYLDHNTVLSSEACLSPDMCRLGPPQEQADGGPVCARRGLNAAAAKEAAWALRQSRDERSVVWAVDDVGLGVQRRLSDPELGSLQSASGRSV